MSDEKGIEIAEIDVVLGYVNAISSLDDAREAISRLDTIKALLKAQNQFREQSVRFAKLEAVTLIKIVELGGDREIKNYDRRKAAVWLASHSEDEREQLIAKCEDGLSIVQVWKREVQAPEKRENAVREAKSLREKALADYRKRGVVHMVELVEHLDKTMPADDARDFYQGTRDRLLRMGAVGLEDGEYTYCDPEKTTEGIDRAVDVRVRGIIADVQKLAQLMEKAPRVYDVSLSNGDHCMNIVYAMMCALGCVRLSFSQDRSRSQFIADIESSIKHRSTIRNPTLDRYEDPLTEEERARVDSVSRSELERREIEIEIVREKDRRCAETFMSSIRSCD